MAQLMNLWKSPSDVNSPSTREMFRLKHKYQEALFAVDTPSWDQWNECFLKSILSAAEKHPGQRIVVTVGAEHIYWLKEKIDGVKNIQLLDFDEARLE